MISTSRKKKKLTSRDPIGLTPIKPAMSNLFGFMLTKKFRRNRNEAAARTLR